jgi:nucleotide-binding universal stress UspA family protein
MNSDTSDRDSAPLTLVIGLDFTDAGGFAFDQAVRVAKRVARSAFHVVHVFDSQPSAERSRELADHLRLYLDEKGTVLGGLKGITVGIHLRSGKPARELVQLATEVGADLIVVGSHSRPHMRNWLLGSTAERLIANAPCPVLVAGPKPTPAPHELVIEPPCPDCLRARAMSRGAEWWCERHSHEARRAHTFSYQRELPFASHDSEVIPTGIKL